MSTPHWSLADIQKAADQEAPKPIFVYKHSTRCSVSRWAWMHIANHAKVLQEENRFFFVDVISERSLSNQIAAHYKVTHESPQLLQIVGDVCIKNASHDSVNPDFFEENI
jgi:bacillithiol system protein YtxJ